MKVFQQTETLPNLANTFNLGRHISTQSIHARQHGCMNSFRKEGKKQISALVAALVGTPIMHRADLSVLAFAVSKSIELCGGSSDGKRCHFAAESVTVNTSTKKLKAMQDQLLDRTRPDALVQIW